MAQVFVNPLEDSGFKILFRKEKIMTGFLETVLNRKIEKLEYMDTEQLGVTIDESKSRFDLAVRFDDGTDCVVEMQRACLRYFNYRAVFYSSHLVQRQATEEHDRQFLRCTEERKRTRWNYYFRPVYFIGILENGWGETSSSGGELLEHYRLRETGSGEDMKVDYNFIFLRLDRFDKSEQECLSSLDRFAYSLKTMGKAESRPGSFSDEWIMNMYDEALIANLPYDIVHQLLITGVMTTENDWLVAISEAEERAVKRGMEKGMEKGLEQGMEKGLEQGLEQGMEQGMEKGKVIGMELANSMIARRMKECGIDSAAISKCTGLSEPAIDAL